MASRPLSNLTDRLLGVCPLLIALLWVAGIAHFRDLGLQPIEWAVVVASGFALQVVMRRFARPKPLPKLPEGARPIPLAALAAIFVACLAAVVGGIAEAIVENHYHSDTSWALRTIWHAACAYGASYCSFLQRLLRAVRT